MRLSPKGARVDELELDEPERRVAPSGSAHERGAEDLSRRDLGEGSMTRLILGLLVALLMGCASAAQRDAAREAWDAHDATRARECRGAAITGTCIGGGGP
jgi:hypothetical protein